jgi:hypothetical protein
VTKTLYKLVDSFTFNFKTDQSGKIKALIVTNLRGVKSAEKTSDTFPWGIIGTATTSGWDGKDIVMQTKRVIPIYFISKLSIKCGRIKVSIK